jgi:hypothetical protein
VDGSFIIDGVSFMSCIYCLFSTADGIPRYIGQSTKPASVRYAQHLRDAIRQPTTALHRWINAVVARGFQVRVHVLQTNVRPGELDLFERYWMSQFSSLLNSDRNRATATSNSPVAVAVHRALRQQLQHEGPSILGRGHVSRSSKK